LIGLRQQALHQRHGEVGVLSGDFAKFGLTTPELIRAVEILKTAGKLELAKLFHFHVGSQLTDIRTVKDVVNEGARFYPSCARWAWGSDYFDVGGGLGVDYVGARSTSYPSSLNYSMEEYAADVVLHRAADLQQRRGAGTAHRQRERPRAHRRTIPAC